MVRHLLHPPFASRQQLGDGPHEFLGGVDRQGLEGLVQLSLDRPGHHLGLADGQLEALPAHLLDEDRQGQFAASLHLPGVGPADVDDPDGDVADELGVQPRAHHPCRQLVAGHLARER